VNAINDSLKKKKKKAFNDQMVSALDWSFTVFAGGGVVSSQSVHSGVGAFFRPEPVVG